MCTSSKPAQTSIYCIMGMIIIEDKMTVLIMYVIPRGGEKQDYFLCTYVGRLQEAAEIKENDSIKST